MPLVEELQAALRDVESRRHGDEALRSLREFRDRMLREGVLVVKAYDLPPVDTIGRLAYAQREPADK